MVLSLIAAVSRNSVIGKGNKLPWHLPADLKRFKQTTMGKPVIMGRKTFESIGKPLPGRSNIIVTRQSGYPACGATVVHSLREALDICADAPEAFVIGGAQLFQEALRVADKMYLTLIHADFEGDTLFRWDPDGWKEVAREDRLPDAENPHPFSFVTFEKRR